MTTEFQHPPNGGFGLFRPLKPAEMNDVNWSPAACAL